MSIYPTFVYPLIFFSNSSVYPDTSIYMTIKSIYAYIHSPNHPAVYTSIDPTITVYPLIFQIIHLPNPTRLLIYPSIYPPITVYTIYLLNYSFVYPSIYFHFCLYIPTSTHSPIFNSSIYPTHTSRSIIYCTVNNHPSIVYIAIHSSNQPSSSLHIYQPNITVYSPLFQLI